MTRTFTLLVILTFTGLLMAQSASDFVHGRDKVPPNTCGNGIPEGNEICYRNPEIIDQIGGTSRGFGQLAVGHFDNVRLDFAASTSVPGKHIQAYQQGFGGAFTTHVYFGGTSPEALGAGDLNQDGDPDLVTAGASAEGGRFYGDFGFDFKLDSTENNTSFGTRVRIGDVTGDGLEDLVISGNFNPAQGMIEIWEQDPLSPGNLVWFGDYVVDATHTPMELADMDLDGTMEVVFGSLHGVGVIFVSGANQAAMPVYTVFPVPTMDAGVKDMVVADLSDGSVPDVIIMYSDYLARGLGSKTGKFNKLAHHKTSSNANGAIVLTDTNKDGALDMVTGDEDTINVYINQNNGNADFFPGKSMLWNAFDVTDIVTGDFNNDSFDDLLYIARDNMGHSTIYLSYNNL